MSTGGGGGVAGKMMRSHARAVVGRGLTSGLAGALRGLEALGGLDVGVGVGGDRKDGKDGDADDDDDDNASANSNDDAAEKAVLRRSMWSALLAVESSFQLTCRPELLGASSGKGGKEYKERLGAAATINTRRAAAGGKEYKERLAAAATINTRRAAAAAMWWWQ